MTDLAFLTIGIVGLLVLVSVQLQLRPRHDRPAPVSKERHVGMVRKV